MRPSARASIFRTLLSAPSWTGNAPGLLTLPTTNTLPASGTRTSSPPERCRLASASVPSISALTDTRCISEAASLMQRVSVKALIDGTDADANLHLSGGEEVRVPEAGKVFVVG